MTRATNLRVHGRSPRRGRPAPGSPARRFRSFLASWSAGEFGYAVYSVAVAWLAYRVFESAFGVAIVLGIEYAAYALIPLVGPIVDRARDLRRLLVLGYLVQSGLALLLFALASLGALTVGRLLLLVVLLSLVWNFTWTGNSIVPSLLLRGAQRLTGQAVSRAGGAVATLAGFAIGGLSVATGPVGLGMMLYGAALLAAVVPLLSSPFPEHEPTASPGTLGSEFLDGWREFRHPRNRVVVRLTIVDAFHAAFAVAPAVVIPLLVAGRPPMAGYAAVYTAYLLGGGLGGLWLAWRTSARRAMRYIVGPLVVAGALVALAPWMLFLSPFAEPLLWLLVGGSLGAYGTVYGTLLQRSLDGSSRGRLVANAYLFSSVGGALGALVLAATLGPLGPVGTSAWVGAGLVATGLAAHVIVGRVASGRRQDRALPLAEEEPPGETLSTGSAPIESVA